MMMQQFRRKVCYNAVRLPPPSSSKQQQQHSQQQRLSVSFQKFSTKSNSPTVTDILQSRGLSPQSSQIVYEALKTSSILEEEQKSLAKTLPILALKQMESAMQQEIQTKGVQEECVVQVIVQNENNREFTIYGRENESLLDLCKRGKDLKDYLECACNGNMTCSTCHVYVISPEHVGKEASQEEQDMIDIAWEPRENQSRLGCQLKLNPKEKLVVEIPKMSYNHFK
jgi:ferredoxin